MERNEDLGIGSPISNDLQEGEPLTQNATAPEDDSQVLEVAEVTESAEDIKVEPESKTYPDFDKIKKEEPTDEPFEKTLPELEEQNDMFDDVDGPEYVDLSYEGIAEVDGVDYFVCEEFKIRQVPKPVIITRPLYQLFDCILSEHIILDPEYQREIVWDEGRAALLINSILMGYFIPPIIFNVVQRLVKLPDGTERMQHKRICVDGKQRLTSVWKFMTGQIGFFDSNTPQKKWYFCHPTEEVAHTNANRNILPNSVKEFFKNQAFCCYEYDELTQDTEETMFQLVQKGIAMTPGEKMRAMSTEWANITKEFEDDYPTVLSLSKQQRGSGFRLVLTIFAMIQEVAGLRRRKKITVATVQAGPTLQASQPTLNKILQDKEPIDAELKLMFRAIFDKFADLVRLSSTELTNSRRRINRDSAFDPIPFWLREKEIDHGKSFSPIELIATAILITLHMDKHTDEELLEDIMWMRHYLRTKNHDLRVNTQCWRVVWDFVSVELNTRRSGKASMPAFLNNHTTRTWAKKRQAEDKAIMAKKAAQVKAKAARAKKTAARVKVIVAKKTKSKSTSAGNSSPSKSRSSARRTKTKPRVKAMTKLRSPSKLPEVLFPNLFSETPEALNVDEDSSSNLSEVEGGENDDGATISELAESEEETVLVNEGDERLGSARSTLVVEIPSFSNSSNFRRTTQAKNFPGSSKLSESAQSVPEVTKEENTASSSKRAASPQPDVTESKKAKVDV